MVNSILKPHRFQIRVYHEDTDAAGIVYYANYLRYAERARTELMRGIGIDSSKLMRDERVMLVVRRCSLEFIGSAVLDDNLVVKTELTRVSGASLEATQKVCRFDSDLVDINLKLGCMSLEGNATRLPKLIRETLTDYFYSTKS